MFTLDATFRMLGASAVRAGDLAKRRAVPSRVESVMFLTTSCGSNGKQEKGMV